MAYKLTYNDFTISMTLDTADSASYVNAWLEQKGDEILDEHFNSEFITDFKNEVGHPELAAFRVGYLSRLKRYMWAIYQEEKNFETSQNYSGEVDSQVGAKTLSLKIRIMREYNRGVEALNEFIINYDFEGAEYEGDIIFRKFIEKSLIHKMF